SKIRAGEDAAAAGSAITHASGHGRQAGSPKYVVHIGEGVQGLLIGDGTVQHNDFRPPPEAQEMYGPPPAANSEPLAVLAAGESPTGPAITGSWRKTSS